MGIRHFTSLYHFSLFPHLNALFQAWKLAFKVVSGKWDSAAIGTSTFWDLFTSTGTYSLANEVQNSRDFTATSDHYKSSIVEDWENKYISVQAVSIL